MAHNVCTLMIRSLFNRISEWRFPQAIRCQCFALAALAMITAAGCREEKKLPPQPPRAELTATVDWLGRHYQASPPGKNWAISSITVAGSQVLITVAIPQEQAAQLMRQPADTQFRLVAEEICPGKNAAVWQRLPAGSRVTVLPCVSGQVFIEVDCGH